MQLPYLAPALCIVWMLVFSPDPIAAQTFLRPEVKLGVSRANIHGLHDDAVEMGMRTGVTAGLGVAIGRGGALGFRPELLFTQKGSVETSPSRYGSGTVTHVINYVELPLLLTVEFLRQMSVSPQIYGGPTAGIKAGEQVNVGDGAIACDCGGFKHTEFGIAVGGGLSFPISANHRLLLDARLTQGLTGIADEHTHGDPAHQGRNRVFGLMVGVRF